MPKKVDIVGFDGEKMNSYCTSSGIGFPLLILVIGIFWLLKDMGIIKSSVSLLSVLLIAIALWMIIKRVLALRQ